MPTIPKRWIYKVSSASGVYLGTIKDVQNDFVLIQDINKIGPNAITIEVPQSADTAKQPVKAITTEAGDLITTEAGQVLTTEGQPQNFMIAGSQVRNGNRIEVTEVSSYYPNGTVVFVGKVKKWNVNFGTNDNMTLYCIPDSTDLNNYLAKTGDVIVKSNLVQDTGFNFYGGSDALAQKLIYIYGFNDPPNYYVTDNLSAVSLLLSADNASFPATVTVSIFEISNLTDLGTALNYTDNINNAIASSSLVISSTTAAEYKFIFPVSIAIKNTTFYFISVTTNGISGRGANVFLHYSNINNDAIDPLGQGIIVTRRIGVAGGWQTGVDTGGGLNSDLYFKFYSIPQYTKSTVTSFEPSSMVKTLINNYQGEGGQVSYNDADIVNTGVTVASYTFSTNTIVEAIDALLSLSPSTVYYTVRSGTNKLIFKNISTTADHTIIYKKHIQNLDLSASIENLKNRVYLTGGDVAGTNLFLVLNNQQSIDNFDPSIDRIFDQRITVQSTGYTKLAARLDRYDDEVFETSVTLIDTTTDINQYNVGDTVGFKGFGTTVDDLILPIVRIARYKNHIELNLGNLPLRSEDIIDETADQLATLQAINNPNQPV